jgi:hypothetical protein
MPTSSYHPKKPHFSSIIFTVITFSSDTEANPLSEAAIAPVSQLHYQWTGEVAHLALTKLLYPFFSPFRKLVKPDAVLLFIDDFE